MRTFLLLVIGISAVTWVNCAPPPRRSGANASYPRRQSDSDDFFSSFQDQMDSMYRSVVDSLDSRPEARYGWSESDWLSGSDAETDELIRRMFNENRPSQRRPQPPSNDAVYRRTQVSRPAYSTGGNGRPVVVYTSSDPRDGFLGYWDRLREQFMSMWNRWFGDDGGDGFDFSWNNRRGAAPTRPTQRPTPRATPRTTPRTTTTARTTARTTPNIPVNDAAPSVPKDRSLSGDKSVETNSGENDGRDTVVSHDGEIEVNAANDSGSSSLGSSSSSTDSSSSSSSSSSDSSDSLSSSSDSSSSTTESIQSSSDQSDVSPRIEVDENPNVFATETSVSDSIDISPSQSDLTTLDYNLYDTTTSSQVQSESEADDKIAPIDSDSSSRSNGGDVSSSSESNNNDLGTTVIDEISGNSLSSGNDSNDQTDVNVSSTDDRESNSEADNTNPERQLPGGIIDTARFDVPSTTIRANDEIIVPENSMPKYDTDQNENNTDEIVIHELPPVAAAGAATSSPAPESEQKDSNDGANEAEDKPTMSTLIGDSDQSKSVNSQDNEIPKDDADDKKAWENPMGNISVGRFLKKVSKNF